MAANLGGVDPAGYRLVEAAEMKPLRRVGPAGRCHFKTVLIFKNMCHCRTLVED